MDDSWLLLIYTVPAAPSRKRAFVWREIKRVGAVYLRDGVCTLQQTPAAESALATIAQKVREFGGRATIVKDARLDDAQAREVREQMQAARSTEYAAIRYDAEAFLGHIRRETAHRDFNSTELEELDADVQKLRRWYEQVRARDHVKSGDDAGIDEMLHSCKDALAQFMESASPVEPVS